MLTALVLIISIEGCDNIDAEKSMMTNKTNGTEKKSSSVIISVINEEEENCSSYDFTSPIGIIEDEENSTIRFYSNKEQYNSAKEQFETVITGKGKIETLRNNAIEKLKNYLNDQCIENVFENLKKFFKKFKESEMSITELSCKNPNCNKPILRDDNYEFLLYPDEFKEKKNFANYTFHCPCMAQYAHHAEKDVLYIPICTLFDFEHIKKKIKKYNLITNYLYSIVKWYPDEGLSKHISYMMSFFILHRLENLNEKLYHKTLESLLGYTYPILHRIYNIDQDTEFLNVILSLTLNSAENKPREIRDNEDLNSIVEMQNSHPVFQLFSDKIPLITIHCVWEGFRQVSIENKNMIPFLKSFTSTLNSIDPIKAKLLAVRYTSCPYIVWTMIEDVYKGKKLDITKTCMLLSCIDQELAKRILAKINHLSLNDLTVLIKKLREDKAILILSNNCSNIESLNRERENSDLKEIIRLINEIDPRKFKDFLQKNTDIELWEVRSLEEAIHKEGKRRTRIFGDKNKVTAKKEISPKKTHDMHNAYNNTFVVESESRLHPNITTRNSSSTQKRKSREKASTLPLHTSPLRSIAPHSYIECEDSDIHQPTTKKPANLYMLETQHRSRKKVETPHKKQEETLGNRKTTIFKKEENPTSINKTITANSTAEDKTAHFGFSSILYPTIEARKEFDSQSSYNRYSPNHFPNYNESNLKTRQQEYSPLKFINPNTGSLLDSFPTPRATNDGLNWNSRNYTSSSLYNGYKIEPNLSKRSPSPISFSRPYYYGLKDSQIPVALNDDEKKKQEYFLNLPEVSSMMPKIKDELSNRYLFLRYLFDAKYFELEKLLLDNNNIGRHEAEYFINRMKLYNESYINRFYTNSYYISQNKW